MWDVRLLIWSRTQPSQGDGDYAFDSEIYRLSSDSLKGVGNAEGG